MNSKSCESHNCLLDGLQNNHGCLKLVKLCMLKFTTLVCKDCQASKPEDNFNQISKAIVIMCQKST